MKKFIVLLNKRRFEVLIFFLLAALYSTIVIKTQSSILIGDENRYVAHAEAILNGIWTPDDNDMWLWNGPGYPTIIAFFMLIFSDIITPVRLLNAFLLSGAILLFYRTALKGNSIRTAFVFSVFFAFYILIWKSLPYLLTEILSIFLLTLLMYQLANFKNTMYNWIKAGFTIGFLCMVKFVFGYIIILIVLFSSLYYLIKRTEQSRFIRNSFIVGFVFCTPWLGFTYSLTGKFLYWGASSGTSIYWMSNPTPHEYGEWMNFAFSSALGVEGAKEGYIASHGAEIKRITQNFTRVERDDEFKRVALDNIKKNPTKYLQNVWCNVGRFFFNYPYSYYPQQPSTLINVFINGPILGLILLLLIPSFRRFTILPAHIQLGLVLFLIYTGVSILVSSYIRMFYVFIPCLFLWFSYMLDKITFHFNANQNFISNNDNPREK
jgi:4-amino-4-deoxy-L-arabinose transferase-like glycosyltransferase